VFGAFVFPIILSLSKGGLSPNGEGLVFYLIEIPIILSLSKDRLSPNGEGLVFYLIEIPIILSLSKGRLSLNGVGFVFDAFVFPIILSLSKDRLSPKGVGGWGVNKTNDVSSDHIFLYASTTAWPSGPAFSSHSFNIVSPTFFMSVFS
jgi:hypothetical protein